MTGRLYFDIAALERNMRAALVDLNSDCCAWPDADPALLAAQSRFADAEIALAKWFFSEINAGTPPDTVIEALAAKAANFVQVIEMNFGLGDAYNAKREAWLEADGDDDSGDKSVGVWIDTPAEIGGTA